MSRLADNLVDFFKVINADNHLWRLLYYPTDPLNPTKAEVRTLPDFNSTDPLKNISKTRIVRAPKTDNLTTQPICRLCMYFGNGDSLNRAVSDQDVIFDVYAHIDTFEINESRSLKIIDRLNKLLNESKVTGVGKIQSGRRFIIGSPPAGYIGYKVIYTFGSGK